MHEFNPIIASQNLKDGFIDYIATTFDIADKDYAEKFRKELQADGSISRGPYLEVSGSYKTGESIEKLIQDGKASPLFRDLETVPELDKEIKITRPLYTHQVQALEKANNGQNLVVTTGTGSGKTECFVIPVINSLLREIEAGTLDDGVRAIIIYPMNALANDQIKRLRKLLKSYPRITFGLYNGNTEHDQMKAESKYRIANPNSPRPMKNELISREKMQETPPHILITNYSMLEYMMLRPKDDIVFSGAKLKYVILDEAHIYKGTTGMETSLLMRRLWARISTRDTVQYILTSATLGGREDDEDIVDFARTLCCDVDFKSENIIRSEDATPEIEEDLDFPEDLFCDLADERNSVSETLKKYDINDYCPDGDDYAKLYNLLLHSRLFRRFRELSRNPIEVSVLMKSLNLSKEQMNAFITVCTRAEINKTSLIKAKYHFFIRALEGAYAALNEPKKLFLNRKEKTVDDNGRVQGIFEIAVCSDCGRLAVIGKETGGKLTQSARRPGVNSNKEISYYMISDSNFDDLFTSDNDEEYEEQSADQSEPGANDYVICPRCQAIAHRSSLLAGPICDCEDTEYVNIVKIPVSKAGNSKCPVCGFGNMRSFYLGYDSATSVLGTQLYEQLPDEEIEIQQEQPDEKPKIGSGLFNAPTKPEITKPHTRQFLCFSDSRSDAAFFAVQMEKGYQAFLRRRGILQVINQLRNSGTTCISVKAFVDKLTRFFDDNESFEIWNSYGSKKDYDSMHQRNQGQAWIAVLDEMFNARRSTSLPSLGYISFEYKDNENYCDAVAQEFNILPSEAKSLLNLLVMDAVYIGAIIPGSSSYSLSDAEREYIFFSPFQKQMVLRKTAENVKRKHLGAWAGRKRENGNYFPNYRITRLIQSIGCTADEADDFLEEYWRGVFQPSKEEYVLSAEDFNIRINGDPQLKFYRCRKCGRFTAYNVKNMCAHIKCGGELTEVNPEDYVDGNHYVNLYKSQQFTALQIKEHTAQLSKIQQEAYQKAFVDKKINALSCSTTFEMGVDVGTLETVYMRDIPPSPANYVQRAGRAGRALHTAAFILTYAKLSSHDLTFFNAPEDIISGKIKAPVFTLDNRKVAIRHIYAVALSKFFACSNGVYNGDNAYVFLNQDGYEQLKTYLENRPEDLKQLLCKSIPARLHKKMGINDWSWTDTLIGSDGVLEVAVEFYREEISKLTKEMDKYAKSGDYDQAGNLGKTLKRLRCGPEDGQPKKSLIDFLVRNNVLPKYGFPVDTVELKNSRPNYSKGDDDIQLNRDLSMAIAEYAPGAEVIADGKLYKSRYIKKIPGRNTGGAWETSYYCICPNCKEPNLSADPMTKTNGYKVNCVSCGKPIPKGIWAATLEPRMGFMTEDNPKEVPLRKPERDYKTDDYYVGDIHRKEIKKIRFQTSEGDVELESTANDSLAVVGQTAYHVCQLCGYADENNFDEHKNSQGFPCANKTGNNRVYRLSHTFRTDVAKITFFTADALDKNRMYSVMFALLEGISKELGVERTDIKGTLHQVSWDGALTPIYSIILYDGVAGGAGHVRRIVTEDGKIFKQIINAAINIADSCRCDKSCYQCLRNYYNQKLHDLLDRHQASDFLKKWCVPFSAVPSTAEPDEIEFKSETKDAELYNSWSEYAKAYFTTEHSSEELISYWDKFAIPRSCITFGEMSFSNQDTVYEPYFIWKDSKTAVFANSDEFEGSALQKAGWKCFAINSDPQIIKDAIENN